MKLPSAILVLSTLMYSGITLAAETPTQPEEINSALKLNKEQKSQLIKYHATAEECMNNIDSSKYQPRLFLKMVKEGKFDDAVFTQQMNIQNTLHTQAARCRINYYISISNMLTKEQKEKLVELYQHGDM
jgi:Spy/CpxP family protein refolding chaperone